MTKYFWFPISVLALLILTSTCKKDNFLSNDERDALFSQPNKDELDIIYREWQSKDLIPIDYTVISENEIFQGKFNLKIVSFKVSGIKEYGALLVPKTDSLIPVRMLIGGFDMNFTANTVNMVLDNSSLNNSFILAIPALRGQSLKIDINGTEYTSPLSDGDQCDAFNGATDDVLAFLNLIQKTESYADVSRTSVRGGSRGGTVAMLAGIRDDRIKRVVGVVSPTNMLELTSQNENDPTYKCQFLSSFKNGETTLIDTRNKMIASSPIYFAKYLPLTQLHMGLKDWNVPINQGYDFEEEIKQLGMEETLQLFTYDRTHTDIATNNAELSNRIEQFLSRL
jgi:pimeloyl-ACP methyl ester carboxylesterase